MDSLIEIIKVTNSKEFSETGGGHNQKGVEFQRNWALVRMFELETANEPDYLFLFEAIQDIAILDSSSSPKRISIYQVKKKDRNEWSWGNLTNLHKPNSVKTKPLNGAANSPIGKLYLAIRAFKLVEGTGRFVSNAGCDLEMADGTNAATSLPICLADISSEFRDLVFAGLASCHDPSEPPPDLKSIFIERVSVPVDDASTYAVGKAHELLFALSPSHAGQARSFVDALLAKIGPLGARTDTCATFEQVKERHGFGRRQLKSALADLQEIPDVLQTLETWLSALASEGMSIMQITRIRSAASAIFRHQLIGGASDGEEIAYACDEWLVDKEEPSQLIPFLEGALLDLQSEFKSTELAKLQAHILLRAIAKCVVQI